MIFGPPRADRIFFDDDAILTAIAQFTRDCSPDAPRAANDVVPRKFSELAFHTAPAKEFSELEFYQRLRNAAIVKPAPITDATIRKELKYRSACDSG